MRWKLILSIVAAITVALIVTVFALLSTYDFNKFKSIITKAAKDATGRELKIAGDIDLKIGFNPALVMEGVSLENATWGSRPQMARVKLLEVQVVLLPLIRGFLEVKRLIVIEPDILIETNNTGKSNLEFETVDKAGIVKPEEDIQDKSINLPALAFKDVRIEEGRFEKYGPEQTRRTIRISQRPSVRFCSVHIVHPPQSTGTGYITDDHSTAGNLAPLGCHYSGGSICAPAGPVGHDKSHALFFKKFLRAFRGRCIIKRQYDTNG